jgi:hypothetical protein
MAEAKKRVRRTFGTIILQKFDAKSSGIEAGKYEQFRVQLESLLKQFDRLLEEGKKAKKVDKRRYRSLSKFTKKELEDYIKSME